MNGKTMMELAEELFPICRSITGEGVRKTLNILKREIPELEIKAVKSGTEVFDWIVPKEWKITDAFVETLDGKRVIDFKKNNLHLMGYSIPVDANVTREDLFEHLYTVDEQPTAVPYVTSYYEERWGFCCSKNEKDRLTEEYYHVKIESELFNGVLNYGEVILPGRESKEVMFSTYICHPSMANNEISGPVVLTNLINKINKIKNRRYTYRFIFTPETIGVITYLSKHLNYLKENVVAGFNVTCVGDSIDYSYISSPYGNNLADKALKNILRFHAPNYKTYSFLERGSDERQYCSPLVNLPFCCFCRSKYGVYPEYHTSLDDLDFISEEGLQSSLDVLCKLVNAFEYNYKYSINICCEPQLGKRGLYPTISRKGSHYDEVKPTTNFIAYADGTNDLFDISNIIGIPMEVLIKNVDKLRGIINWSE